jgi:hypothetical protein
MKRTTSCIVAVSILIATLFGMGCSTDSSQSTSNAAPTLADIEGTWKNVFLYSGYYGDEVDTTIYEIKADGTFTRLYTVAFITEPDENCSYAEKGTVSINAEGKITFLTTHTYENWDEIVTDLATMTWTQEDGRKAFEIALHNGDLYIGLFKRVGTGDGIKGTWVSYQDDGTEELKAEIVFGNTPGSNAAIWKEYRLIGSTWVIEDHETEYYDSYVIENGRISFYKLGQLDFSSDYVMTDSFISLDSKYVKQ